MTGRMEQERLANELLPGLAFTLPVKFIYPVAATADSSVAIGTSVFGLLMWSEG